MENKDLVKTISGLLVSSGTGIIVGNIIKTTTPVGGTKLNKFLIGVGSIAVTGLVSGAASKYTDEQIDLAYQFVDKFKKARQGIIVIED